MIINPNTTPFDSLTAARTTAKKSASESRANNGANQTSLAPAQEQVAAGEDDISVAGPQIQDAEAATASVNYARGLILGQSATAMLTQAISLPQSALRLLEQ